MLGFANSDFVLLGRERPGADLDVEVEERRERARESSVERAWIDVEESEMALILDFGRGTP